LYKQSNEGENVMSEGFKYAQLHIGSDAWVSPLPEQNAFSLHFESEQGGCTVAVDRPTLERLQVRIAHALTAQQPREEKE